ncbi:MAG: molybdopterin molybdotransferase MoeA [Candidatus Pelagadaptatus aseana]|uniref:molybdopterin molybdotransferase MoeA n=1 Tax=Candidatus Pelagadaptatus aseana TaxID=3120508 RepID=UPI0039B26F20
MDFCNTGTMMPFEEARAHLANAITPIKDTVEVPIGSALDRILAQDILSPIQVPGYDNSAMDGYAVRAKDLQNHDTLTLIGKSFAGTPYEGRINPGQCVRIMTGAKLPDDADTVIMQENTNAQGDTEIGDQIIFSGDIRPGSNIRRAGEDIDTGHRILAKGKRLSPADIGLLASVGIAQVTVFRAVKVGIFSTGDELRRPGQPLDPGCIYESNRFVVMAILQRLGADIVDFGIIEDNPQALEKAFIDAAQQCDAVVSSGGVSVGEADYTKDILDKLGSVGFWKVAIKPGKPFAFGTIGNIATDGSYFFGLPGNPVSATVTFHQLALPVLQKLAGERVSEPLSIQAIASADIRKSPGRLDFQRGNLTPNEEGQLHVATTGQQGSGILSSISKADCYLILEREQGNHRQGDTINVQPFDRWLV